MMASYLLRLSILLVGVFFMLDNTVVNLVDARSVSSPTRVPAAVFFQWPSMAFLSQPTRIPSSAEESSEDSSEDEQAAKIEESGEAAEDSKKQEEKQPNSEEAKEESSKKGQPKEEEEEGEEGEEEKEEKESTGKSEDKEEEKSTEPTKNEEEKEETTATTTTPPTTTTTDKESQPTKENTNGASPDGEKKEDVIEKKEPVSAARQKESLQVSQDEPVKIEEPTKETVKQETPKQSTSPRPVEVKFSIRQEMKEQTKEEVKQNKPFQVWKPKVLENNWRKDWKTPSSSPSVNRPLSPGRSPTVSSLSGQSFSLEEEIEAELWAKTSSRVGSTRHISDVPNRHRQITPAGTIKIDSIPSTPYFHYFYKKPKV